MKFRRYSTIASLHRSLSSSFLRPISLPSPFSPLLLHLGQKDPALRIHPARGTAIRKLWPPNTIAYLSQGTDDQRSNYARERVIKALISNEIFGHGAPPAQRTFNSGSDHTQHDDALDWLSRYGTANTCAPQSEHPTSIPHNYEGTSVEANLILHWFCEALNSGQPCYLSLYVGDRCPSWTFPTREFQEGIEMAGAASPHVQG
jgi:hypothetical protein